MSTWFWILFAAAGLILAALAELDAWYWRKRVREYRAYCRTMERDFHATLDARTTVPALDEWTAELTGRPGKDARTVREVFHAWRNR